MSISRMLSKKRVNGAGLRYLLLALLSFIIILPFVQGVTYQTGNDVYGILVDSGNTNVTGALNLTLQVGTCSLVSCSDINWSANYTNATYTSLVSLTNSTYFQYRATFFTENQNYTPWLFNVSIDYTYIDTTYPLLAFVSPTPSNNSGASGSIVVNVSITEENLANVSYNWNGTLLNFNSTNESLTNLGAGSWIFTYTQTGLVVGQSYTYNVSIVDFAGITNNTETRTIRGNAVPTFPIITNSTTGVGDVDPYVNITITVNISDTDNNFDSAKIQWKNSTGTFGENNVSLINITAKAIVTKLNATLTLPSYEENITYRIWANDTTGDSAVSGNYTLSSYWDCTWTSTSEFGAVTGWDQNKQIGNLTINNTGDSAYSASSCSLDFRLTYDLAEGRIYYDGEYVKNLNSYTIPAKGNRTIEMNATFLNDIVQENLVITLDEFRARSTTGRYRNTTGTLVSNQNGPYLYKKITSSPSEVSITAGNFSLIGYIRNLMGSTTINENNTAYNVSLYWELPSGLTNISGSYNLSYVNITENNLNYSNINVSFSSIASFSPGVKTIYLKAFGYNISNDLIVHAGNVTLLSESINISFTCYNISDGVYVTACGSADGDYVAPTTEGSSSSSSSSGGGGGGSSATSTITSRADFHLIRGKQNEIIVPFVNLDSNASLKNLRFSVTGKLANFIEVSPLEYLELRPKEKIDIKLKITSPSFYEIGKQEITLQIRGSKSGAGVEDYNENKKIIVQINEISREDAMKMIQEMNNTLELLNKTNIGIKKLSKLVDDSREAYGLDKLEEVIKINQEFVRLSTFALDTNKIIDELKGLIEVAKEKGISTTNSERILKTAELSMQREDFEQAHSRIKEAQVTYALDVKGEIGRLSYYLKNNPTEIAFGMVFLFLFSISTYKFGKLRIIKNKIKKLKDEENVLMQLMKLIQKYTFQDNKMSIGEYQESMLQYEKKLAYVIEQLIELESERAHALRFTNVVKMLNHERDRLIGLIKEIQTAYLEKGKMETRAYELRLQSYQRRIGEVDQQLATLEAKKVMKGRKLLSFSFFGNKSKMGEGDINGEI